MQFIQNILSSTLRTPQNRRFGRKRESIAFAQALAPQLTIILNNT
jgi:hypothetical protein